MDDQTRTNDEACEGQRPEQASSIRRAGARHVEDAGLDDVRVQVAAKKQAEEQRQRGYEDGGTDDGDDQPRDELARDGEEVRLNTA